LLLASVVGGALWLSGAIMPNEYEPLHAFLALVAVLAASMLGTVLTEAFDAWSARLEAGAGALLATAALFSGVHLASDEDDAWLLWSQTVASRYLTERWSFLETPNVDAVGAHRFVPRPNLETPQTAAWRARRAEKPPHIVIFSIDGLLPSHVGAYGYRTRSTTPNIDRVAKRGVRFNRAFSTYPATKQFNSSLLLGRLVPSHGASHAPSAFKENAITRLLDRQNYHILVKSWFESSTRNSFDARYFGIDTNLPKASAKKKGFQLEESMESRMERIEQHLLDAKAKKQPVFLWMHLLGTHPVGHEFVPDPQFAYGDSRAERYDSAVAGSDRWLPEVEKLMKAHADPTRDTIWIICSDHGVRVDVAGKDLYAHIVRVPLIIAGPGFEPRVLDETVEAPVDLAATVVDLAGIEPPASYDGISLVPLLVRGDPGGRMAQRIIPLLRGGWRGAVQGRYKVLSYNKTFSFFDSERDPEEEHNIYSERKELAQAIWGSANQELERRLEAFKAKEEVAAANEPAESNAQDEED
jgi:arylsulfatase A-like enzyme